MSPKVPGQVKIGPHSRADWHGNEGLVIHVHGSLAEVQGQFRRGSTEAMELKQRYHRAKYHFDMTAATDIVAECIDPNAIENIIDLVLETDRDPLVVMPHPEFDSEATHDCFLPTNAIPFAFAGYLAASLGCEVDNEIGEIARPGRTKLSRVARFLWQPKFSGVVSRKHAYIIVDDVCTICGTLAALRSHIVSNGGTVVAVSALGRADGCRTVPLPIAADTLSMIYSGFGAGIRELWLEEVGHELSCLTEMEGRFLAWWHSEHCAAVRSGDEALQRFRTRLSAAAAKGR